MAKILENPSLNAANFTNTIGFVEKFHEDSPILSVRNILKSPVLSIFVVDNFVKTFSLIAWYYKRQATLCHKISLEFKKRKRTDPFFVHTLSKVLGKCPKINENSRLGPTRKCHWQELQKLIEEKF